MDLGCQIIYFLLLIQFLLDFKSDEEELGQLQKMCQEEYEKRAKNHRKYHMGLVTRVGAEKSLESVSESRFRLPKY